MALGFDTVSNVIAGAATECGLTFAAGADPYASTDPAIVQMLTLLTTSGRELCISNPNNWQQLTKNYTITTVYPGDSGDYALPADFNYMIDQSGWERTLRNPLGGPLDSQDWQMVTNNNTLASIYVAFRIFANQFSVFPRPPANGLVINFEYISRYWVAVSGSTTGTKDAPTLSNDVILFEYTLMVKWLKVKFLEARGMDTSAAQKQLNDIWGKVVGIVQAAPVLSLTRRTLFPYLGDRNIPTTRYGL
jgi:hypothetical protein